MSTITEVGNIGNYYGGLKIKAEDGKFYWSITNWDGDNWDEIPEYLYKSLMRHQKELDAATKKGGI